MSRVTQPGDQGCQIGIFNAKFLKSGIFLSFTYSNGKCNRNIHFFGKKKLSNHDNVINLQYLNMYQ